MTTRARGSSGSPGARAFLAPVEACSLGYPIRSEGYAAAMFGMGGSEILVILIVALLFLGPDKLPEAAKQISKGIRDIKKQSRNLQQTIENDERIGGAIRDLRSALRGEEPPPRPKPPKQIEAPTPDPAPGIGGVAAAIVAASGDAPS